MAAKKKHEDMTSEELMAEANKLRKAAQEKVKVEVKESFNQVVTFVKDIRQKMESAELTQEIEEFFEDRQEDLVALRELIADKKAETSRQRRAWTANQKAKIIKEYDAAKEGSKTAVLKAHSISGNPIGTWKTSKDVKTAMQKVQEKKK